VPIQSRRQKEWEHSLEEWEHRVKSSPSPLPTGEWRVAVSASKELMGVPAHV